MARRILIVEDASSGRQFFRGILSNEYSIVEAENGEEAIAVLRNKAKSISAIILDIMMPVMDGFEVLRKIRDNIIWSQIPVIVTTADCNEETHEKALSLGADAFIPKPVNLKILKYTLCNCIHMRETSAIVNNLRRDKLTGLLNRESFFAEAESMIAREEPGYFIISCFNVDNFKLINDQYSTKIGDEVLCHIANCLRDASNYIEGLVCRYMVDKYAVIYPSKFKDSEIVKKIHDSMVSPPCIDHKIKIRVGRYSIDNLSLSVSEMFDRAAMAEESIKGKYGEVVAEYRESMRTELINEQRIVGEMQDALHSGQFEPWYQPQYNHVTGAVIGAEALVRWRHPEKGMVAPGKFIPVFERNGFIYELDKYIWKQVCIKLRSWIDRRLSPLPVSVNISRYDLFADDFLDVIIGLVNTYNLPIELLRLEITESAFSESPEKLVGIVKELIGYGFTVEIDDFGSGYSSLNTLKDVPAQIVKLDMRFLEKGADSQRGGSIIESVVRLVKWLDMAVIAEGVETREQADYLRSVGCYYIQGYYYSRPVQADEYEKLFTEGKKENRIHNLEALDAYNNNAFWDPQSLETMVFNHYSGGAFIFEFNNGHCEMLRINNEFAKAFKSDLSIASIMKLEPFSNMNESDKTIVTATLERAFESGKAETCEVYSTRYSKKGKGEYIRLTIRLIAHTGERYLFYGYVHNITAQHLAEMREIESSRRFKAVVENIDGGISAAVYLSDDQIKYVFANERFYSMFGYTRDEADRENFIMEKLIVPEDYDRVRHIMHDKLIKKHQNVLVEFACHKKNGERIEVRCSASLTNIDGMGENVVISVLNDITNEVALRRREAEISERLHTIASNVDCGITAAIIRHNKAEILYSNDRFYELIGFTRDEYNSSMNDYLRFIHPDDLENTIQSVRGAALSGQKGSAEFRIIHPDGKLIWVRVVITHTSFAGINEMVELGIFTDITAEKEADEQLRFLNDISGKMLVHSNADDGINATLENLCDYFKSERAYVFEYNKSQKYYCNTYEVCGEGVIPQNERLKKIKTSDVPFLDSIFDNCKYYMINDVNQIDDSYKRERKLLQSRNIKSLVVAPLYREGEYIGFIGIDNLTEHCNQIKRLYSLGDYIAVMLTRRDFARQMDDEKDIAKSIMDGIPGGFARMKVISDDNIEPMYFSRGLCELVGFDRDFIKKSEHKNALKGVHPDDDAVIKAAMQTLIKTGEVHNVKFRHITGDNGYRWLTMFGKLHTAASGEKYIYLYYSDATSIKMAEDTQISLLDNIPCGAALFEYDLIEIKAIHINKYYWNLVGRAPGEYKHEYIFSSVHPDDIKVVAGELKSAVEENRIFSSEIRIAYGENEYRYFHVFGKIMPSDGEKYVIYAAFNPIDKLHEAKFEIDTLLNVIPSGILKYSADEKEEFAFVSRNFMTGLGYTEKTFKEKFENCFNKMVYSEDRKCAEYEIRRQEVDGKIGRFDYRIEAADGTLRWFHDEGVKVTDEDGKSWYYITLVDINERKKTEQRLKRSEEEYRLATAQSETSICRYNIADRCLFISQNTAEKYGISSVSENMPYSVIEKGEISGDSVKKLIGFYNSIHRGDVKGNVKYQRLLGGQMRWIDAKFSNIFSDDGNPVSAVISFRDITEQIEKDTIYKKWAQSLNERPKNSYTLFSCNLTKNTSFDSVEGSLIDIPFEIPDPERFDFRFLNYVNEMVYADDREKYISALSPQVLYKKYCKGKRTAALEYRELQKNGEFRWLRCNVELVEYANSTDIMAYYMFENIDIEKRIELKNLKRAENDALTGLFNRIAFVERFNKIIEDDEKTRPGALMMLDMDGFKLVNDNFGHTVGDRVLVETADMLTSLMKKGDLLCRLGGDEFLIYLNGIKNTDQAAKRAGEICKRFHEVFNLDVHLSTSIGISVYPDDGDTFETLYSKADSALYSVKGTGKDSYAFFSDTGSLDNDDDGKELPDSAKKRKMLIVDDQKTSVQILSALFDDSFETVTAYDGNEALVYLRRHSNEVSIILLDLIMPGADGFSVLRKMQQSDEMKKIPVIAISGIDNVESGIEAIRCGASDFVPKPVNAGLIRHRVNVAVGQAENNKKQ